MTHWNARAFIYVLRSYAIEWVFMHFCAMAMFQFAQWLEFSLFTGRNEVVAKVMFLLVSVILFTGGSASVHAGITPTPSPREPDPPGSRHPLGGRPIWKQEPPGSQLPGKQAPPPGSRYPWPPGSRHPPAYGQWAAGTYPTGMHSCFL